MMKHILPAALLLAAAGATPAWAHAFLEHAQPAAGTTVATAPTQLDLYYTEGVVPHFSRVQVKGPAGTPVKAGAPRTANGGRELIVPVPALTPGTYTVTWQVTAQDTHKTQGSFKFTVR